ncbi:PepSY-associated TM helix domain-containing protein [Pseudomonas aeruginosa]|uniref:PepSY-associated TM helix domain-containing protein n=1 Tax=Pseudomonas aeruginosa TaxID=287 RepID=UPI00345AD761
MRADFIRIYKSVHTWTGIISGMALFIAFYAGALTVFKEPLARWVSPPSETRPVPLSETPGLILEALARDPAIAKGFVINLRDAEDVPARMQWQVRAQQADDHDDAATRQYAASLDSNGAVRLDEIHPSPLANFIDVLHRVVGLPTDSDPNRWIMGIVAALYTLALVSGVIVLLPTLAKDFFALRVGKNLKRMWLDAHNVVGILSLPFHLVMALSAVVFAYHDQIYALQDRLLHGGQWSQSFRGAAGTPETKAARDPSDLLSPVQLLRAARELAPGLQPSMLQYQQIDGPRAVVRVWGKDPAAVSPRALGGFAAFDPYTGKLLNTDYLPGRQDTPNLFISSFFALHMASFGGTTVLWLYFLLGMAGAWLFYSGNLLWIETRRRKANKHQGGTPRQRLDTRLMAAATVGICLGCVCGISLTIVGGKWLNGWADDLTRCHQALYYSAFFTALAWSFWRGAARAAVQLLWSAALLTLCIPLTTLQGWLVPATSFWAHTSPATLGVDAVALAGALCFAWMARTTAHRTAQGRDDSVWSSAQISERAPNQQE